MGTIRVNGSTSGYVELAAPAVAGSTALTLPLGGFGKFSQVVQGTTTTSTTIASTTFTDTTLTASITLSSTSSKVLVIVNQVIRGYREAAESTAALRLLRDGTVILDPDGPNQRGSNSQVVQSGGSYNEQTIRASFTYLDSPASISALTYKTQGRVQTTANNGQMSCQGDSTTSFITLIEVLP